MSWGIEWGRRALYLPAWNHSRGAALDTEDVGLNLVGTTMFAKCEPLDRALVVVAACACGLDAVGRAPWNFVSDRAVPDDCGRGRRKDPSRPMQDVTPIVDTGCRRAGSCDQASTRKSGCGGCDHRGNYLLVHVH